MKECADIVGVAGVDDFDAVEWMLKLIDESLVVGGVVIVVVFEKYFLLLLTVEFDECRMAFWFIHLVMENVREGMNSDRGVEKCIWTCVRFRWTRRMTKNSWSICRTEGEKSWSWSRWWKKSIVSLRL